MAIHFLHELHHALRTEKQDLSISFVTTKLHVAPTEFIVLRGRSVSSYFTYCLARTYNFRQTAIKSMIGSSGRQRVQPSCFDDFMVATPCHSIREEFDEISSFFFAQIAGLTSEILSLTEARDLLIPRLMNGEVQA